MKGFVIAAVAALSLTACAGSGGQYTYEAASTAKESNTPRPAYTGPELGRDFLDPRLSSPVADGRAEHVQNLHQSLYGDKIFKEEAVAAFNHSPSTYIHASRN